MVYEEEYLTIDGCWTPSLTVALIFYAISFDMIGGQYYHHLLWLETLIFTIFFSMNNLVGMAPPSLFHTLARMKLG